MKILPMQHARLCPAALVLVPLAASLLLKDYSERQINMIY